MCVSFTCNSHFRSLPLLRQLSTKFAHLWYAIKGTSRAGEIKNKCRFNGLANIFFIIPLSYHTILPTLHSWHTLHSYTLTSQVS